jgi:hypothetical protein
MPGRSGLNIAPRSLALEEKVAGRASGAEALVKVRGLKSDLKVRPPRTTFFGKLFGRYLCGYAWRFLRSKPRMPLRLVASSSALEGSGMDADGFVISYVPETIGYGG